MIVDKISNLSLYRGLSDGIDSAIDYLEKLDTGSLKPGDTEIDGERLYMMCQEYDTKPVSEGRWETHRRYIDIQYVVEGTETIVYNNPEHLTESEPYDKRTDKTRYTGDGMPVTLRAGQFLIAFPDDAHKACVHAEEGSHHVLKAVMKIHI